MRVSTANQILLGELERYVPLLAGLQDSHAASREPAMAVSHMIEYANPENLGAGRLKS